VPAPADALLMVGMLRAECHRTGIRDVSITGTQARLGPVELKMSETMRLKRIARDAIYKEDQHQLVVPLKKGVDAATQLVAFLRELVPVPVPVN